MVELHLDIIWGKVLIYLPNLDDCVPLSATLERQQIQLTEALPVVKLLAAGYLSGELPLDSLHCLDIGYLKRIPDWATVFE